MNVKFVKYHKDAKMPEKAHGRDFGYDVYAISEKEISPGVWQYGLGFGLQVVRDEQIVDMTKSVLDTGTNSENMYLPNYIDLKTSPLDIAISIRPRSGIYKTGMVLVNAPGTGDEPYTGEYRVTMYHLIPALPRYKVGDKIAQLHLDLTFPMNFIEVDELNKTDRGDGGFGSTDKK